VVSGLICAGSLEEVRTRLQTFRPEESETIYEKGLQTFVDFQPVPAGEQYVFSQERMAATTLSNVIYPVYTQGEYIKHNVPGNQWLSLYTWDAGFVGLGLVELDVQYAIDVLNQYVTSPDSYSAFTHHGSTVPVQVYLFQEIWNKTQSEDFLKKYYPRVKQMHQFLAGEIGHSSTKNLQSNLLRPWDYFYNSGGWDDYPPQHYIKEHEELAANTTPVVTTAQLIRTAKILKLAALHLGLKQDVKLYDRQIEVFSQALIDHAWDEESGYFAYVQHDEKGEPTSILSHESSENFNKGLDGVYPLVSGEFPADQTAAMMKHLQTRGEIWSDIGLSAVDQSAPYYLENGYWNGTVWMPHQWFFWKAMLDHGEGAFANKIATTGLDVWKREVDASYYTFEHFLISTGRGAGWHHFSGLSTPVLAWFKAYFVPGNLTCGFDTWISQKEFNADNTSLTAKLEQAKTSKNTNGRGSNIVVCMNPGFDYEVLWNGKKHPHEKLHEGVMMITMPKAAKGRLEINQVQ
jgi:hypothetical protein